MKKKQQKEFDLYTFVAEDALKSGEPFQLSCNCSGKITIMPPFQDDYVICPKCEKAIKIIVIEGDPGCIIGADKTGNPILLPVQGSKKRQPYEMSKDEISDILASFSKLKGCE